MDKKEKPEGYIFGAPTKYRPEYNTQAFKFALLGATDEEMADFFGVCVATLNNWKIEYPDFLVSINNGKVKADAQVAEKLYNRACGAEWIEEQAIKVKVAKDVEEVQIVQITKRAAPDTQAASIWLNNRRPKNWKNKQEIAGDPERPLVTSMDNATKDLLAQIGVKVQNVSE